MKTFDEIDLNRLYEALSRRLETFDHEADPEEFGALVALRDRIGGMLDDL